MSKTVKVVLIAVLAAALFFLPVAFAENPVTLSVKDAETSGDSLTVGSKAVITAVFTPDQKTDETATDTADSESDKTDESTDTSEQSDSSDTTADTTSSDTTESTATDTTSEDTTSAADTITVTFSSTDSASDFDGADTVTVDAVKNDDGSYTATTEFTINSTKGIVYAKTSDNKESSVSFVASVPDTSEDETVDETPAVDNSVLTIHQQDANTAYVKDNNIGFSAVLTKTDADTGKETSVDMTDGTFTWSAKLGSDSLDIVSQNDTDGTIVVKPAGAGTLTLSCVLELNGKTYNASPISVKITDEAVALTGLKITADKTEGILPGDTVTVSYKTTPAEVSNLKGAAVVWTATQNGEKIAESSNLSDFVFSPDKVGDITVDLSVTPEGADAVTSKSITLTMDAPTIESVTINPVTDIDNGVDAGTDVTFNAEFSPAGADQTDGLVYKWTATDSKGNTIATSDQAEFTFAPAVKGIVNVALQVEYPEIVQDSEAEDTISTLSLDETDETAADETTAAEETQTVTLGAKNVSFNVLTAAAAGTTDSDTTDTGSVDTTTSTLSDTTAVTDNTTSTTDKTTDTTVQTTGTADQNKTADTTGTSTDKASDSTSTGTTGTGTTQTAALDSSNSANSASAVTNPVTGQKFTNRELGIVILAFGGIIIAGTILIVRKRKEKKSDYFV